MIISSADIAWQTGRFGHCRLRYVCPGVKCLISKLRPPLGRCCIGQQSVFTSAWRFLDTTVSYFSTWGIGIARDIRALAPLHFFHGGFQDNIPPWLGLYFSDNNAPLHQGTFSRGGRGYRDHYGLSSWPNPHTTHLHNAPGEGSTWKSAWQQTTWHSKLLPFLLQIQSLMAETNICLTRLLTTATPSIVSRWAAFLHSRLDMKAPWAVKNRRRKHILEERRAGHLLKATNPIEKR